MRSSISRRTSFWFGVLAVLGALPCIATAAQVTFANSIRQVADAPQAGALNPHRAYITRKILKATEASETLDFEVSLKMKSFAELQARVAHGERLSVDEMAAQYNPSSTDYAKVNQWLTSLGFTIIRQDSNHLAVFAEGTVSQIQTALQTTFARVSCEGIEYTSAVTAPSVPATISPLIVGINGLQPHLLMHKHLVAKPNNLTGPNPPFLPSQIAQAYNASGLYSSSVTGTGQTIAIAIDTFPKSSDLTSFWSIYGVNQSINNVTFIQVVRGTLASPSGEETLDTEWSSSIAPGAKVRVYAAKTLTSSHLDQVYQQIYSDVINHSSYGIHQMSMSYGIGETYTTSSQVQTDDQFFAELASAGVTIFASSGDGGSTPGRGSAGDETGPLQVESPASDPNVTGVGGTTLTLTTGNNENTETVWNNSSGACGGGASIYFSQPSWQTGTGVPTGTTRLVPDISSSADPFYGAVVIINGSQVVYGGTSWSSPTWAGFCALINQNRANSGYSPLGLFGPYLYPLLGTSNFRDITSGNNATSNSNGLYAATTGYDEATGIGVPNVQTLAQTLPPVALTAPVITSSTPPGGTVGTAYSFTYTASGNPAPTFSLTAGSFPPNLMISTTGVLSGTPTTGGSYSGTVTASNGVSPAATQNFTIAINQAPTFTNGAPTATATVGTAYSFTYSASGYPAPTYSVTSGSLPTGLGLSSSGSITGTATASGVFTGTVTATNGISPDATQNFSITVNQAPAITSSAPTSTATNDSPYAYTFQASGYPAPTFSVTSGSLPPGLSLSSAGIISGTPTADGVYTGIVTATNGTSPDATQSFSITVADAGPPTDTPTLPPWGMAALAALLVAVAAKLLPKSREA